MVSGAALQCTKSFNPNAVVYARGTSNNDKNGGKALKDTDIHFTPNTFELCKKSEGEIPKPCKPVIYTNRWLQCSKDQVDGRQAVTMSSFMVCICGWGRISVLRNGQMPGIDGIPYGEELTEEQIEELVAYIFGKVGWTTEEDCEYIAKCMKVAGMDTRMSIEFFILTCCTESGKGARTLQDNGEGRGFIQLTKLSSETWEKLAEQANEWRVACGKDKVAWETKDPTTQEIMDAAIDRDKIAWEGSIYYWCNIGIVDNNEELNNYVKKYENGSAGEYKEAGLYYAVQCFVNGANSGTVATNMRKGEMDSYTIVRRSGGALSEYDIIHSGGTEDGAPNGSVERARVYMEYYDLEEQIWNFSDEIIKNWDTIST